jgi:predicted CXXCH cytochrome family protein
MSCRWERLKLKAMGLAVVLCFVLWSCAGLPMRQEQHAEMFADASYFFTERLGLEGATYVGSESCGACHEKTAKEFKLSSHARISLVGENVKGQDCEMCHGPASIHLDESGKRGTIVNPKGDPQACFVCHIDKKSEFSLPFHHPVLEGKMSCSDCHSPHGAEVRPWSATTLEDVNQKCFECHKAQRGPFVWQHEAVREGCTTCHAVHGSMNSKLLVARDNNLCLRCHTQVDFPTIGNSSHATRLPGATCFAAGCHTGIHGSNFDDHLRY